MSIQGDAYNVYKSGGKWIAEVFAGSNIAQTIEAKSERQAHYLVKQEQGDIPTLEKIANAQYNSPEGRAWRAKMARRKED